jgi:peptidoglycan hydrolase-like protein with peptidoglycan-binding domain
MLIKLGSSGSTVRDLTTRLHALNLLDKVSSSFDPSVKTAVMVFQQNQVDELGVPLKVDGVVGPLTWWRLTHLSAPPQRSNALLTGHETLPSGGGVKGREALRAALAEIKAGAGEIGGDNRGAFVRKYLNGLAPEGKAGPWCAGFVSWCCTQNVGGNPLIYSVAARDLLRQAKDLGLAYIYGDKDPEPGDLIIWKRFVPGNPSAGHRRQSRTLSIARAIVRLRFQSNARCVGVCAAGLNPHAYGVFCVRLTLK